MQCRKIMGFIISDRHFEVVPNTAQGDIRNCGTSRQS